MGLAMLRGHKTDENRGRKWQSGWYFLHVGRERLSQDFAAILAKTWPDALAESAVPFKAVLGMVELDNSRHCDEVVDPWALGPFCSRIVAAVEFATPMPDVKGKEGIWHITTEIQALVQQLLAEAVGVRYVQPQCAVPRVAARHAPAPKRSLEWPKRFPRKPRERSSVKPHELPQPKNQFPAKMAGPKVAKRQRELGIANLHDKGGAAAASIPRHDAHDATAWTSALGRAKRLKAGRTVNACLFMTQPPLMHPVPAALEAPHRPERGPSCQVDGHKCFIVNTFTRRGVPMVDIALLARMQEKGAKWHIASMKTVRVDKATSVGLHFKVSNIERRPVEFEQVGDANDEDVTNVPRLFVNLLQIAATYFADTVRGVPMPDMQEQVCRVVPATAVGHCRTHAGHRTVPRQDKKQVKFVMDLPVPVPVDLRPHRCVTCQSAPGSESGNYFKVTFGDFCQQMPQVRILHAEGHGVHYVQPVFLAHMLHLLYEEL